MAVRQRKVELAEVREGGEGRCGDAEGRSDRLLSKPVAGGDAGEWKEEEEEVHLVFACFVVVFVQSVC
jgi:hypothetical protein